MFALGSDPSTRGPLRRDAERNRERLLAAAAAVTALKRDGTGVSMARIAEEAGVGVATLYRRYPSREHLLEALQRRSFELVLAMVKDVEAQRLCGRDSIRAFLQRTVEHGPHLVMVWHGAPPPTDGETRRLEDELHGRVAAMVECGIADGSVRADVQAMDVIVFGAMVAQPLPTTEQHWAAMMQRQIDVFIDGVAAP